MHTLILNSHGRAFTYSGPLRHARDIASVDVGDCLTMTEGMFKFLGGAQLELQKLDQKITIKVEKV